MTFWWRRRMVIGVCQEQFIMRGITLLVGALFLSGVLCRPNEDLVAQTVAGNNHFAREMYKAISEGDDNIIFSPLSIHVCLAMLYQGSTGHIHEDLEKVLGVSHTTAAEGYKQIIQSIQPLETLPEDDDQWRPRSDPVTISVADKIYVSQNMQLKSSFQDVLKTNFYSEVQSVDFTDGKEASKTINTWVEQKTHDRIKDLLSSGDVQNAALVLVNAIYFKGAWQKPFFYLSTQNETFYLAADKEITVPMMEQTDTFMYKEDADLDARIVELPYYSSDNQNQFSMIIVLPNKKDGLHELEQKLAGKDVNELVAGGEYPRVNIKLPKFNIEQTIDLQESFEKIGLESVFKPSHDLSGLLETDDELVVSKAIHKAFIEVDEKGTKAAAATALAVGVASSAFVGPPEQPQEFHADHPFAFTLIHRNSRQGSSNVLFCGRVSKPEL